MAVMNLYAYQSKIASWNAGFKVLLSVIVLVMCIGLDRPSVSVAAILAMAYVTVVRGGIPLRTYMSGMGIVCSFVLLGTIAIGIDFAAHPAGQYSLYVGFGYVYTSAVQLRQILHILLRVVGGVSALQMLVWSTPVSEIISVLQKVHVPKLIVELMYLMYRFIFILLAAFGQMGVSAKSRQGYCDYRTSCLTFAKIAGNVFIISVKKASTYYNAMEARCYDGTLEFLTCEKPIKPSQVIGGTLFIMVLLLLWKYV